MLTGGSTELITSPVNNDQPTLTSDVLPPWQGLKVGERIYRVREFYKSFFVVARKIINWSRQPLKRWHKTSRYFCMATTSCHRKSTEQISTHLEQIDTRTKTLLSVRETFHLTSWPQQGEKKNPQNCISQQTGTNNVPVIKWKRSNRGRSTSHRQQTLKPACNSSNTLDSSCTVHDQHLG